MLRRFRSAQELLRLFTLLNKFRQRAATIVLWKFFAPYLTPLWTPRGTRKACGMTGVEPKPRDPVKRVGNPLPRPSEKSNLCKSLRHDDLSIHMSTADTPAYPRLVLPAPHVAALGV
jgi:hypothetical protein